MKNNLIIAIFLMPVFAWAQPVLTDKNEASSSIVVNPLVGKYTKNYVDKEYITLQKRAAMMGINETTNARGSAIPLQAIDVNEMTSGMDTIKMTGTKTSIFNAKK